MIIIYDPMKRTVSVLLGQFPMKFRGHTRLHFSSKYRPSDSDTCSRALFFCFFVFYFPSVRVLAKRKALCSWLGAGLRVKWEGTMSLLILSNAKFIGYHL